MKIEFIKQTPLFGKVRWYTEIDGRYQSDSISSDEKTARNRYESILKDVQNKTERKEILESVNI